MTPKAAPDEIAYAKDLVEEALHSLALNLAPHLTERVRQQLLDELLQTDEGLREVRRNLARHIREDQAARRDIRVHPEDLAWALQMSAASPGLTAEQAAKVDRMGHVAHVVSARVIRSIEGTLPSDLVEVSRVYLCDFIEGHPVVDPLLQAATASWRVPATPPPTEEHVAGLWPRSLARRAMFKSMDRSLGDFFMAVRAQELRDEAGAIRVLEPIVLGAVAAQWTGMLAAIERLGEADRELALEETSGGRRLLATYLRSLAPPERDDFERVSWRLDLLPRHETMEVLEPVDAQVHHRAMIALGAYLGRRNETPLFERPIDWR